MRLLAAAACAALLLSGCQSDPAPRQADATPKTTATPTAPSTGRTPLRAGERYLDLRMPSPYTPAAPHGGTDDYRCFLLDPHLRRPTFVTGVDVLPGNPDVVHHVILFQVPREHLGAAEAADRSDPGEGWTCFGGAAVAGVGPEALNDAPWIGAWAPGGGERVMPADVGIPLAAGTRVVMQVHYNLLAGRAPDVSSARLRVASGSDDLAPLDTMLLVAPVELPCRPGHDQGRLCRRSAAVADTASRFGSQAMMAVAGLQYICGGNPRHPRPGPVQHCDRTVTNAGEIRAVAGHMHLLGRRITIELNPGTPDARTLVDIHPWNFDEQGSVPVDPPARVEPGDVLRVTCRHSQHMRDLLPALQGQPERYVVWGEGTTDEMCLGVVLLTHDSP